MKYSVILASLAVLSLCCPATTALEKSKPCRQNVLITVKMNVTSGAAQPEMTMQPKVSTLAGTPARIKIGDTKDNNNLTTVDLTPVILTKTQPAVIKLDMKLSMNHKGWSVVQDSTIFVVDGREPYKIEFQDLNRNKKLNLELLASLAQDKADGPARNTRAKAE
jgi:hypothetical protein